MMPIFAQSTSLNSTTSLISKETVEEPAPVVVELDPEVANQIIMQCKNIIHEYEQMHNLDVIYTTIFNKSILF